MCPRVIVVLSFILLFCRMRFVFFLLLLTAATAAVLADAVAANVAHDDDGDEYGDDYCGTAVIRWCLIDFLRSLLSLNERGFGDFRLRCNQGHFLFFELELELFLGNTGCECSLRLPFDAGLVFGFDCLPLRIFRGNVYALKQRNCDRDELFASFHNGNAFGSAPSIMLESGD